MKKYLIGMLVALALSVQIVEAADGEKATYVGGGRYVGEGRSTEDAMIRQRSDDYTERQRDRERSEEREERVERRERAYESRSRDRAY